MTLIELMVASAILFFAITAVFGLIMTSTNMSLTAKQQNVAINSSNSYIEQVRALPYEQVGVHGGSVDGSMTAETTMVASGFLISIRPTVTWVDDPGIQPSVMDYKRLVIVTTVSLPHGGRSVTRTFTTLIRKNTDVQTPPDWRPPTITFTPGVSPVNGAVLPRGGESASSVHIQVVASAQMAEGTIQDVSIRCDTGLLQGTGTNGVLTSHWGGLTSASGTFDFYWDTTQLFEGNPIVRDGPHWLVADVVDSIGQTTQVKIGIIVDNYAPTALSATPTVSVNSDTLTTIEWGKAWDPEGPQDVGADCYGYTLRVRKQPLWTTYTYGEWPQVAYTTVVANLSYPAATQPLSRYRAWVMPTSPRGLTGPRGYVFWVTPPRASGSYADINPDKQDEQIQNKIVLSAPTFDNSARTYTLYRSLSAAGPWTAINTDSSLGESVAYTYTDTLPLNDTRRFYYRVQAVVTPASLGDFTPVTVVSNIIGPNDTVGSGALADKGW